MKDPGLFTIEIEGVNSVEVSSRSLNWLRSRAVFDGCEGAKPFVFIFNFFLSVNIREKLSPNALLTKPFSSIFSKFKV